MAPVLQQWWIKLLATGDPFNLQFLSPPGTWNWKFQPSNHVVSSPGNHPSFLSDLGHYKNYLINITKEALILHPSSHLGNFKGFRSSVLEIWMKTKYILMTIQIIIHNSIVPIHKLPFAAWYRTRNLYMWLHKINISPKGKKKQNQF